MDLTPSPKSDRPTTRIFEPISPPPATGSIPPVDDRDDARQAMSHYPADCQPNSVESLGGGGGFSGARLWRIAAPRGRLCLRRWPPEHPSAERLELIQRVLWHVAGQGFRLVPAPI